MTDRSDPCRMTRRTMIAQAALGTSVALIAGRPGPIQAGTEKNPGGKPRPFGYCLNTGTIHGQNLALPEMAAIAAKAGYQAIEPRTLEIQQYVRRGGNLADLKKRIADSGLTVPSAIGFADWINDDEARRAAGLEQWRREAEMVASIGGQRLAAPPIRRV